jgi:hypothetical protein
LFDTQGFNKIIDICETNGVLFRVTEWELGLNIDQETSVTIQCISGFEMALEKAEEQIVTFCQ